MKIQPKIYARAFAEAAAGKHSPEKQAEMIRNFLSLIKRNGDAAALRKILEAAEKSLREKEGLRKITFSTARPLPGKLREAMLSLAGKEDIVEEKIESGIVAGMRVTINDEKQFDATLERRLQKMFNAA